LIRPGEDSEVLLDVPAYDFNWQTAYRLETPLTLPAGSFLRCMGYFDNSERNLANPDPERDVYWGDQTDDEMMIGYFDVAVPVSAFKIRPPAFAVEPAPQSDSVGHREQPRAVQRIRQKR
jgi:hypothetical protein